MRSSEATRRRRERKKAEILKRLQTPKDNGTLGEGEYVEQPIGPGLQAFTFTQINKGEYNDVSPLAGQGEYFEQSISGMGEYFEYKPS